MNKWLTLTFLFSSLTLVSLAILSLLQRIFVGQRSNLSQRLGEIVQDTRQISSEIPTVIRNVNLSQIPTLNRILQKFQVSASLSSLLEQADLKMKVGELILLCLVLGSVSFLFTLKAGGFFLILLYFALFSSLPLLYVYYRKRKRLKLFEDQFPDAIDMMGNSIRAGFALGRAIQLVAEENPDPIGMEFKKTFEEVNLGIPIKDALMNLTKRIDSVDLRLFVTAILIQRETGGNLTEILAKISTTIRARFKLMGQIKVYTAQGRFSGWILGTLPIALGMIIYTLNPDYIKLLFTDPLGQMMVGIGISLQIIGFLVIQRIVRIKIQ